MKLILVLCLAAVASALPVFKDRKINDGPCGFSKVQTSSRIVGGTYAKKGQYPWIISLRLFIPQLGRVMHVCAGSIIDDYWILTASHCFGMTDNPLAFQVRVGSYNQTNPYETEAQEIQVERVIKHEYFTNQFKFMNDVALLKLSEPVNFDSPYVNRICLPYDAAKFATDNKKLRLAGWGDTVTGDSQHPSAILKQTDLFAPPEATCKAQWGYGWTDSQMLCASDTSSSPCVGDSGGPLIMTDDKDRYFQVGIVSFGETSCRGPRPPVFTRVSYFMNWIMTTMANN